MLALPCTETLVSASIYYISISLIKKHRPRKTDTLETLASSYKVTPQTPITLPCTRPPCSLSLSLCHKQSLYFELAGLSLSLSLSLSLCNETLLKGTQKCQVMKPVTLASMHELRQREEPVTSSLKLGPQKGQNLKIVHKSNYTPFWQLNALMVMVVLSASGMVSLHDLAFVLFSIIYLFFPSKFAFPKLSDPLQETPVFNPESYLVRLGHLFGGLIGIILPIAYIFEGFIEEDKEEISVAAPHVFLLASQVFMNGVACSDRFSIPVRVFVPVFYNAKRIFTLVDWVKREFSKADQVYGGSASERRLYLGKGLAIANLVLWTYHLFFFLLPVPVCLPRAFKKYYAAEKTD